MPALTLSSPGTSFWSAFLLGNGHIGQAMTMHPLHGRITLSHIAFYSGRDDSPAADPAAPEAFRLARKAALCEDWDEVENQVRRFMGRKGNYGTALPVGDLLLEQNFPDGWRDYTRALDLTSGIARCSFTHDGGTQQQTAFCTHADRAFCLEITDDAPMHLRIAMAGPNITACAHGQELSFSAQALESRHSDGACGVKLSGLLRVDTDGCVTAEADALQVTNAHSLRLYLNMNTDFSAPLVQPTLPEDGFPQLMTRHRADFTPRMNRLQLEIPGQEQLCTMVTLGRYLLLSGAREDAALPMSLQGVWNDNVACNLGWTCDMHLDVNTQMNYWLSGAGHLPECRAPLFRWMEERLIPHGRQTAREHYGLPGWAAELVSNAWGWAQPYWHLNLAPCPACGIWEAADYMEHYRYTGARAFLEAHALPVLAEAAEFFLAYLFEQDGQLLCGPAISPESAFVADGKLRRAALNTAFEIASIRQLFLDVQEARSALNLPRDDRIAAALAKLPQLRVHPDGSLAEWGHDYPPADPQHRHMSHLAALHPYGQITPEGTPDLAQAAAESIRRRLIPYDNWEDTGWARSMLAFYAARLQDGEQTGFHLAEMLRLLTTENGLVMHPATRGTETESPVWELDGNTGLAAAALEALLQSHNGVIHLLPALPASWQEGYVSGIRARGGVTVNLSWANGKLSEASLTADRDGQFTVKYKLDVHTIALNAGETYVWRNAS